MKYLSPYKLLALDEAIFDPKELLFGKKKIMAEFELANKPVIEYADYVIDRTTTLKLIEEMENRELADFHFNIFQDECLLLFLETGTWAGNFLSNEVYSNNYFINFISPYFAEAFNQLQFNAFSKSDADVLRALAALKMMIKPEDLDASYWKTNFFLNQKIAEIEEMIGKQKLPDDNDAFCYYFNRTTVKCLNLLPVYFSEARDTYAATLLQLALEVFHVHHQRQKALAIIIEARYIDASYSVKEELQEVYLKISDEVEHDTRTDKKNKADRSYKIVYQSIVWFFLIFAGISIYMGTRTSADKFTSKSNSSERPPRRSYTSPNIDVFFELLVDYHSTNIAETPGEKSFVANPDAKNQPYHNLFFLPQVTKNNKKVNFMNNSPYDAIAFLHLDGTLVSIYNVKSEASLNMALPYLSSARISFYFGRNFNDQQLLYDGFNKFGYGQSERISELITNRGFSNYVSGAFTNVMADYEKYLLPEGYLELIVKGKDMGVDKSVLFNIHITSVADSLVIDQTYQSL